MNYAHGLNNDFVLTQEVNRQYSLMLEGSSNFDNYSNSFAIPVKNRREVELLLLSLGAEAGVIMNKETRRLYPDIWEWLSGRTYSEVLADLKWSCREEDEVFEVIQKIPLPRTLNNFLKLHRDDQMPEPIDREYVHKVNPKNVLISKPFRYGNMFYFNGFNNSPELKIDHNSNHFDELFIFEVTRQTSIAGAHLAGLSLEGTLIAIKTRIHYTKSLSPGEPYIIATITAYKQRGGLCYCVFHITQNGTSCITGYFTAFAYPTKHAYDKFRKRI